MAGKKRAIFEDLLAGRDPSEGSFPAELLKEARASGVAPQMGTTRFAPDSVALEYVYPGRQGETMVITVTIPTDERIVFLPVPHWVVESIWQGEIDGTYCFESEAAAMTKEFLAQLEPGPNKEIFGKKPAPTGRS
ncbi:MAG: hypothetical protein JSS72_05895 [Armatimonadetes bacterium]|nr:hypothetical protein [Armatimonadota bacterium]